MSRHNDEIEKSVAIIKWLLGRFAEDEPLLRQYMGASPDMLEAVGTIEREARAQGWARTEVELALRRLQHS